MDKINKITEETVKQARAKEPKRICFATTHTSAPKRSTPGGYAGAFNVPFGEGFKEEFGRRQLLERAAGAYRDIRSSQGNHKP